MADSLMRLWLPVVLLALAPAAFPQGKPSAKVDFARQIRPILSDRCFACHGPDEKNRAARLRLDTKEGAFAERKGARTVVPGDPTASRLWQRISAAHAATRMPPASAGPALTDAQLALVRRWIEEGANWQTHWAYDAPQRPSLPAVQNARWSRNDLDRFILARLEREGLAPSPEADRATLLRRVTFDLTGLPPSPEEVDAFLKDKAPDAYERSVDRLLASPRYGERMAMQWLDLARYADTHGYHIDSHRDMWPWRDWVIRAFNNNLPFDQFTLHQLAGDLLPNATRDTRIATGFHRNHMINYEGGAIPEEYQTEYVVDRVDTTTTVWMGTTAGCARCHDHKYDPIRQKEYYQLFAFFNTVSEKGLDGQKGNAEPFLPLPDDAQEKRQEELKQAITATKARLPEPELATLQADWEPLHLDGLPAPQRESLVAHYELDGSLADSAGGYRAGRTRRGAVAFREGAVNRAADFNGETHLTLAPLALHRPFTLSLWVRPSGMKDRMPLTVLQQGDDAATRRGLELVLEDAEPIGDRKRGARLYARLIRQWPDDALEVRTRDRIVTDAWHHVALRYDGTALQLTLNGEAVPTEPLRQHLTGPVESAAALQVGHPTLGSPYRGQLDDLRLFSARLDDAAVRQLHVQEPARALLLLPASQRSKEQAAQLRDYFLTHHAPAPHRTAWAELKRLQAEEAHLEKEIVTTMVMSEMEKPRQTHVLGRGDYRNLGEKVSAAVPAFLPPLPKDAPPNRLGFARWLLDPAHPLTSRVAVNRYWQMYFGTGLVKTVEDFGSQGEMPSHPDLLDWLATEFVRTNWDVKAMQRLIVTSATYRQSSRVTPAMVERDPENRLLARGPRFRLPAEAVRDNALAVSGLLQDRVGGPSVFPYQPKGLWEEIAYGDVFSAQTYTPGSGADLYRRSMYTFWKRTSPPPSLATFDAPDREKCAARRPVTNTPLQALVLLNDPTYVEASRALAERMLSQGANAANGLRFGFRAATGRAPNAKELRLLRTLLASQQATYRKDASAAEQLLAVGESQMASTAPAPVLAAWTTVASVLLNLDETITKE